MGGAVRVIMVAFTNREAPSTKYPGPGYLLEGASGTPGQRHSLLTMPANTPANRNHSRAKGPQGRIATRVASEYLRSLGLLVHGDLLGFTSSRGHLRTITGHARGHVGAAHRVGRWEQFELLNDAFLVDTAAPTAPCRIPL